VKATNRDTVCIEANRLGNGSDKLAFESMLPGNHKSLITKN